MSRVTLGSLFDPPPERWGLRGDPGLWDELAMRFADRPLPEGFGALWSTLERAYAEAVGQPLTDPTYPNVPRFDHGGMSAGMIHPETWAKTLFPLICERYAEHVMREARDTKGRKSR